MRALPAELKLGDILNVAADSPTYSRKRSASLSPDFCLHLPVAPLEVKIKQFKEAKIRGVTDPEVVADIQHQQKQLSPLLNDISEWDESTRMRVSSPEKEGDDTSGEYDFFRCALQLYRVFTEVFGRLECVNDALK